MMIIEMKGGRANIFSAPMFILAHTYIAYNICHFQGGKLPLLKEPLEMDFFLRI